MSSTMYANQNRSPVVVHRSPAIIEDTGNTSQGAGNRRSLSDRLRNIFRRNSSSPNRAASNDRRPPSVRQGSPSVRQGSPSSISGKASTDAPQLHAPTIHWPFGKKKSKLSTTVSTPKLSKKKIKRSRKKDQTAVSSMEISNPIYQQENQTFIHGQVFSPRTPEQIHISTGRLQPSTSSYEATTKGFRDYVVIDQSHYSQQVVVPNVDSFTPPTYTSDRSRSPSMNRQRLPNTNIEHRYYHDNSTPTVSIPIADIEVISTPQYRRRLDDTLPSTNTKIVTEKPPISPQTSSRSPSTINTNPTYWKNESSSTLNNTGVRSTVLPSMDVDVPKLNAPSISFGGTSNKKKSKPNKSKSRTDEMASSSSTINKMTQQTSTKSNRPWATTYGSLPDAEIIHGGSLTSLKSSKSSKSTPKGYPGLSAIVQHHLGFSSTGSNKRPLATPTTVSTPRPQRFETSTTTLNEYEQNQSWSPPISKGSPPSPSLNQRHDGYIRPLTPQKPTVQPDVSVIRVNINDLRGQSPDPSAVYRSSATVYTRDKHHYVDGGEIRTWSSHENGFNDDRNDSYGKPPYAQIQIDIRRGQQTDDYNHQIVPSKTKDNGDEHRYSPRDREQELYEREHKIITDQEIQEEERYEVSYEYDQQHHQHYAYETQSHYDQLHSANRYLNDTDSDQNLTYTNRSAVINERDQIYDQSSRSYTSSGHIQEPLHTMAPVHQSEEIPRSYTLKRTDSYDGLGISISANSQSRSNHFIRDVELGSPGDRAGLRKNDRIISINGVNVENVDFSDVLILIKEGLDNDNVQLSVIHQPEQN